MSLPAAYHHEDGAYVPTSLYPEFTDGGIQCAVEGRCMENVLTLASVLPMFRPQSGDNAPTRWLISFRMYAH